MRLHIVAAAIVVGLVLATPARGSEPGEPLDCSDWVFLEPGYSCSVVAPFGQMPPEYLEVDHNVFSGGDIVVTNTGETVAIRLLDYVAATCSTLATTQLVLFDGPEETVIGYVNDRDSTFSGSCDRLYTTNWINSSASIRLFFDAVNGRVLIPLLSSCTSTSTGSCGSYGGGWWLAAIEGFPTLFDILQTYNPAANQIGFKVPYAPEGLQEADFFDTYYGDLATVGDWSQAHPLQCGYPSTTPSPGDYLTVEDTLPDPRPGSGRYYVTAVNHQGERRYGRKAMDGILSGRNPAALPACAR